MPCLRASCFSLWRHATPRTCPGPATDGDPPARFTVTTRKADDTVEVKGGEDTTTLDIKSRSGIGWAVVERKGDGWPKAAVAVRDQKVEVRQWTDGKDETPLAADDPLRLAIRAIDKGGKPAAGIPLDGGHFEVTLPAAFFKDNPKSFTLEWIDFYR